MNLGVWIGLGTWAVTQVGVMIYSLGVMRSRMDTVNKSIDSLSNDFKDMRRELHRVAEGLANLQGKVNGLKG
jgi:hypothetical protein